MRAGNLFNREYMTAATGNIYFTAYDGTVSQIDTTSLSITQKIEVGGSHPEALTSANGKLYINLSNYVWMAQANMCCCQSCQLY